MDRLGRSKRGSVGFAAVIVVLVAVLGLARWASGGIDQEARTERLGATTTAAPVDPPGTVGDAKPWLTSTSIVLPPAPCGEVAELQLHGPLVELHTASEPPDPLADLLLTECGGAAGVVVTPEGDALLGQAGVSPAASYTECAESIRESPVSRVVLDVGTTFCATQRSATAERFGGQTLARVTMWGIDANGAFVVAIKNWPV